MKTLLLTLMLSVLPLVAAATPRCVCFSNMDNRVTVVFIDDSAGGSYSVSDVRLFNSGKEYSASAVTTNLTEGVATVVMTFPHISGFSDTAIALRINGTNTEVKLFQ